ncbi:dihydrolipoyl dehydrogenase family protein [Cellulomonas shaoxiangyii]|uniref:NAD(P)/FAD-dependent oxidoreductase n=1 Tax=Cellulomonas shaoxiangyii TaxID=2566013 RepID=A0A4P7SHU5_9CELL|nr:NAD(P)/FAD-dependent oxidoreductase [Cellulomonas shaoxiangyii]QCB92706.1 NAD(P)/FAD-dependent oxidoreductase [Cellulomonas shaoxiangyii]TGY85831.1 NAD(P)/FAD-dependent oxidoreductase [Cellulomonas shaoxiangyii]
MTAAQVSPAYDLIVIGAGPVGENVADYATKRGLRVAIVESELVGGECSYWACMPSKALLRSGSALRAAERLDGARQAVTGRVDVPAVLARRDAFAGHWKDDGQVDWLRSAGIDLLRGRGRLTGPGTVDVDGRAYTATAVAVATGSLPVLPDVPGLADAQPWGTRDATSAPSVPPRLLVVGGGVAGTELATAYASLGSRVTLVARSTLLDREEPFAGDHVARALTQLGVDVRTHVTPERVDRDAAGSVTTRLSDGTTVASEEILVATGRRANTLDLGIETVGQRPGDWLPVDDTMLVAGTDWLYAVGDVNGRALLTHQGKYQARAAGEAIAARVNGTPVHAEPWGDHVATADHAAVPHVVFTDPEVARAGLTEAQARSRGVAVRAVEYELGSVAGATLHADGYEGRAKLVVDEDRHVVVGATFVGPDVAELLHSATIAIVGEVPLERLWHAVPSYPTISEVWLRLLEAYGRPHSD